MPERKDEYKRSLFLSAVGTLLLTTTGTEIRFLGAPGLERLLHSFLPLAMVCYIVGFALGLLAGRQAQISRAGGRWTLELLCAGGWAAGIICLAFYGMLNVFGSFMLGV